MGVEPNHATRYYDPPLTTEQLITQDMLAEWRRVCQEALALLDSPVAQRAWNEYYQPVLDKRLRAIRKPYDQEADMPALGDPKPCSCTPQQEYYKTLANGDQLKRMNENQFNLIQQLRQEIIDLRCTWSPPANQGLHAVADLELIRELRGELEDAREQLSSLSEWELIAFNRLAVIDHLNNRVASMQSTIKQANELLNSELF